MIARVRGCRLRAKLSWHALISRNDDDGQHKTADVKSPGPTADTPADPRIGCGHAGRSRNRLQTCQPIQATVAHFSLPVLRANPRNPPNDLPSATKTLSRNCAAAMHLARVGCGLAGRLGDKLLRESAAATEDIGEAISSCGLCLLGILRCELQEPVGGVIRCYVRKERCNLQVHMSTANHGTEVSPIFSDLPRWRDPHSRRNGRLS